MCVVAEQRDRRGGSFNKLVKIIVSFDCDRKLRGFILERILRDSIAIRSMSL